MLLDSFTLVDLTHTLSSEIPTWSGALGFQLKNEEEISMYTSSGTHIDAPVMQESFGSGQGNFIDTLPLHSFLVPACVIDISEKVHANYQLSVEDVKEYESKYGKISKESLVVIYSGWSDRWLDAKAYRNVDHKGTLHFPTLSVEAVEYLLTKNIVGIGIDFLSPDPFDSDYPVHKLLFQKGKYIIENLTNLSVLPLAGAYILALPMKLSTREAPARVIGLVPKKSRACIR
ncbi:MAG: cyclase family protein [Chlamydiae bacterium]|nr:cyclase family protein [Chlamydiota bacterium]